MPSRLSGSIRGRARGAALVIALVVVMLATGAAVSMAERQQVDIRRTENLLRADQAMLHARGVEQWALGVLDADRRYNAIDSYADRWNNPLPATSVAGGVVSGRIADLGGRFNLNNLIVNDTVSATDLERLQRLLRVLGLDPALADAIVDWIDADGDSSGPGGAEDDFYSRLNPPYRSANRPFADVSELRRVRGVTAAAYERLRPFVAALPGHVPINVNTAAPEILMCLGKAMTAADARAIAALRRRQPFASVNEFFARTGVADRGLSGEGLAVESYGFEVIAQVNLEQARVQSTTVLLREGDAPARIIRRRYGQAEDG